MEGLTRIVLIAAGIVHLLPAVGVLGARQLQRLYGLPLSDADLLVLMRHRALLFGLLGAGLIVAAFHPALRTAMLIAGLVSTAGFCLLASGLGAALRRVAIIDVPIAAALLLVLLLELRAR
jgi:hypothetical protein